MRKNSGRDGTMIVRSWLDRTLMPNVAVHVNYDRIAGNYPKIDTYRGV